MFWSIWLFFMIVNCIWIAGYIYKQGYMEMEELFPCIVITILGPIGTAIGAYALYDSIPKSKKIWVRKDLKKQQEIYREDQKMVAEIKASCKEADAQIRQEGK